jgi:YjbE family integral membrane protein
MLDTILNLFAHAAAPDLLEGGLGGLWNAILTDLGNLDKASAWIAFGQVLMIDIMLAGDNAIVVGALAAGLPADQRKKVILIGIIAALVLRIIFALVVTQLMQIVGLIFAGGLLLLWVSWKMYRELRPAGAGASHGSPEVAGDEHSNLKPAKSFASAAWAVAVADVSMSLDNVLAVAGAARDHPGILIIGLLLAVALMGVAANILARYIERYRWIAWVGLVVIIYVALKMIYDGYVDPAVGLSTVF